MAGRVRLQLHGPGGYRASQPPNSWPHCSYNEDYQLLPANEKDFEAIVQTVIKAERGAIEAYNKLAQKTHGKDPIHIQPYRSHPQRRSRARG